MRRFWLAFGIKAVVVIAIVVAIGGAIVMLLWNWLTPGLFGWPPIDYAQAVGLLVLCKLLFGGFRGGRGPRFGWRRQMIERWEAMSPEERERLRAGFSGRCGHRRAGPGPTAE